MGVPALAGSVGGSGSHERQQQKSDLQAKAAKLQRDHILGLRLAQVLSGDLIHHQALAHPRSHRRASSSCRGPPASSTEQALGYKVTYFFNCYFTIYMCVCIIKNI